MLDVVAADGRIVSYRIVYTTCQQYAGKYWIMFKYGMFSFVHEKLDCFYALCSRVLIPVKHMRPNYFINIFEGQATKKRKIQIVGWYANSA
jgi:hypothetical protein